MKRYRYEIVLVEPDDVEYLNNAGAEGWRAVGFVANDGAYTALMERTVDEIAPDEQC